MAWVSSVVLIAIFAASGFAAPRSRVRRDLGDVGYIEVAGTELDSDERDSLELGPCGANIDSGYNSHELPYDTEGSLTNIHPRAVHSSTRVSAAASSSATSYH